MTTASLIVGTVIKDVLVEAPMDAVWRAFADLESRDRWFTMPGPREGRSHELDFRVGGLEITRGIFPNMDVDERLEHRSRFIDIVQSTRITTSYEFRLDDVLRFAGLASVELSERGSATRVDYVEQYQFFDVTGDGSSERGEREGGSVFMLRRLKIAVEQA